MPVPTELSLRRKLFDDALAALFDLYLGDNLDRSGAAPSSRPLAIIQNLSYWLVD
jgi:hypothetical protein